VWISARTPTVRVSAMLFVPSSLIFQDANEQTDMAIFMYVLLMRILRTRNNFLKRIRQGAVMTEFEVQCPGIMLEGTEENFCQDSRSLPQDFILRYSEYEIGVPRHFGSGLWCITDNSTIQ
jgi:hypothetical protein